MIEIKWLPSNVHLYTNLKYTKCFNVVITDKQNNWRVRVCIKHIILEQDVYKDHKDIICYNSDTLKCLTSLCQVVFIIKLKHYVETICGAEPSCQTVKSDGWGFDTHLGVCIIFIPHSRKKTKFCVKFYHSSCNVMKIGQPMIIRVF